MNNLQDLTWGAEKTEQLVFALDIGTTSSAVSFCHLIPGEKVEITTVHRWKGQEDLYSEPKVPTIIAYREGVAVAFGAEARLKVEDDEAKVLEIAEGFKLLLHPEHMREKVFLSRPSLPTGVNIQQVYRDFIRFLYEAARDCLLLTACDGSGVWQRLKDAVVLVFAIPNAWEFEVQTIIRDAVGASNIGQSDIRFVTEAEAAVHFALQHNADGKWLQVGTTFLVVDAGGSTVDSTLYTCTATAPRLALKEAGIPICQQAGAIFVDYEMEKLLSKRLHEMQFNMHDFPEVLSNLIVSFERDAKRRFDGTQERLLVNSGIFNLNHPGIVKGKLGLTNSELKEAFDSPIGLIVSQCQSLVRTPDRSVSRLILVGGFGESRYLQRRLQDATPGVPVILPRDSSRKAAAEGAMLWYAKQSVVARMAKRTFGIEGCVRYNPKRPSHRAMVHEFRVDQSGVAKRRGWWELCVKKGEVISQQRPRIFERHWEFIGKPTPEQLKIRIPILSHDGDDALEWVTSVDGSYAPGVKEVCVIEADLSRCKLFRRGVVNPTYHVAFSIAIYFGGTTLAAKLLWNEQGSPKEGNASVIPSSIV